MDENFEDFFGAFEGTDGNQTEPQEETAEVETREDDTQEPGQETSQEAQDGGDGGETAGEVTNEEAEEDTAEAAGKAQEEETPAPFISVKYDKETRQVSMEDAPGWIQKGMNYDRVKEQLDTARAAEQELQTKLDAQKETMDLLTVISEKVGVPVEKLLDELHVNAIKGTGKTETEARAIIKAEKLERQLQAQASKKPEEAQPSEELNRGQRELAEFRKVFPDVKLDSDLAEKLRPDIQAGMSLTTAYLKQENARLKAEAERAAQEQQRKEAAAAKNRRNQRNAPGSQQDSGGKRQKDDFDDFFAAFEK